MTALLFAPASTYNSRVQQALGSGNYLVFGQDIIISQGWVGYFYAPKACVDCSYAGGTKTRPSYFPLPY